MLRYFLATLIPLSAFGQTIDNSHELLWEISGNGLSSPSYLFGTYHSNDKRVFKLSDSTYYALDQANVISIETDVFSLFDYLDTREHDVKMKYDNEGNPYVSSSEASTTVYGDEDGMPQFLDAFFQQYCHNANKQFVPLEDVDFQLNLLSDFGMPSLKNFRLESLLVTKEKMLDLYLKGDIYKLDRMLKSSLSTYPGGYDKIITDRNVDMVDKLDSLLLTDQVVFCAVGAGHLPGMNGVINLLRGSGYNVRKVVSSYSETRSASANSVLSKRSYVYDNDSLGLHILFPGKPKIEIDEFDTDIVLTYRDFGQGNTYEVEVHTLYDQIGLETLADRYIASPAESPYRKVTLDNGGEAVEGLADSYPEGMYWTRIIMSEEYFVIIKAYGGNKFMNSPRAQRFFEKVWFE